MKQEYRASNLSKRLQELILLLKEVEDLFPSIYAEGMRACRRGAVKRYRFSDGTVLWLVVGKSGEYIISEVPNGQNLRFVCSCPDFLFHVLFKSSKKGEIRRRHVCYHVVARVAAEVNEIKKLLGLEYDEQCLPEDFEEDAEYLPMLIDEIREGMEGVEGEYEDLEAPEMSRLQGEDESFSDA